MAEKEKHPGLPQVSKRVLTLNIISKVICFFQLFSQNPYKTLNPKYMPPHCQITLHFLKTNLLALTDIERTSDTVLSPTTLLVDTVKQEHGLFLFHKNLLKDS